jgi:hypothetical protein
VWSFGGLKPADYVWSDDVWSFGGLKPADDVASEACRLRMAVV